MQGDSSLVFVDGDRIGELVELGEAVVDFVVIKLHIEHFCCQVQSDVADIAVVDLFLVVVAHLHHLVALLEGTPVLVVPIQVSACWRRWL